MRQIFEIFLENISPIGIFLDLLGVIVLSIELYISVGGKNRFLRAREDPLRQGNLMMGMAPREDESHKLFAELRKSDIDPVLLEYLEQVEERFSIEEFAQRAEIAHKYQVDGIVVPRRRRAILVGGMLVVSGFALQFIGSII